MADIAHQHQRPARQRERGAVGRGVGAVVVQPPRHRAAALFEGLFEIALHQAEPVAVDRHLVLGIDGRDRILTVLDGGDGRFQDHVGDAGRIGLADGVGAVDHDLDMQAVARKQHGVRMRRVAPIAGELRGILECRGSRLGRHFECAVRNLQAGRIGPFGAVQRRGFVEEALRPGDDLLTALRIVALALLRAVALGDRVGAVERVVERAPARVGSVERIARIHHRHDELRPGDDGDLRIDIVRLDREGRTLGQQIADLSEKILVGGEVAGRAVGAMPGVDLLLDVVALLQQRPVLRRKVVDQFGKAVPEGVGVDAGSGNRLTGDEGVELGRDA